MTNLVSGNALYLYTTGLILPVVSYEITRHSAVIHKHHSRTFAPPIHPPSASSSAGSLNGSLNNHSNTSGYSTTISTRPSNALKSPSPTTTPQAIVHIIVPS